jgi:ubiquinol-cytochrome c reductase cytochrome b subunit
VSRDRAAHEVLDRPRDRPVRTALGAATLSFYVVLLVAGSQDIGAQKLGLPQGLVTNVLRVLLLALPPFVAVVAWKVCRDLSGGDLVEARKEDIHRARAPEAVVGAGAVATLVEGPVGPLLRIVRLAWAAVITVVALVLRRRLERRPGR